MTNAQVPSTNSAALRRTRRSRTTTRKWSCLRSGRQKVVYFSSASAPGTKSPSYFRFFDVFFINENKSNLISYHYPIFVVVVVIIIIFIIIIITCIRPIMSSSSSLYTYARRPLESDVSLIISAIIVIDGCFFVILGDRTVHAV